MWRPAIRWTSNEVLQTLGEAPPSGLVDLWDAVPPNYAATAGAWSDLRSSVSTSLAQGITQLGQKTVAAAGLGIGFRPEQLEAIRDLPGFDVLLETARLALEDGLDIGTMTNAAKDLLVSIATRVGTTIGIPVAMAGYAPGIGLAVALVWSVVQMLIEEKRRADAYQKASDRAALECIAPAYGVAFDQAQCTAALALLTGPDWRDLFLPEARPFDPEYVETAQGWGPDSGFGGPPTSLLDHGYRGFTCCPTNEGARVVAPIGSGIGNRSQRDFAPVFYGKRAGLSLLPMCPELTCHRGLISGVMSHYDAGRSLPRLSSLGVQVWGMLWSGGPSAFSVDGRMLAQSWAEYLGIMKTWIGTNPRGIGGLSSSNFAACDDWPETPRRALLSRFFQQLGMPASAGEDGITNWDAALPVAGWKAFEAYQKTLLERVGIVWVDARSCAPEWRERVRAAQQRVVDHPTLPCDLPSVEPVPDPALREQLKAARRSKGAQCFTVSDRLAAYTEVSATTGPSLAPVSEGAPEVPEIPAMPTTATFIPPVPQRAGAAATEESGSGLALALGIGAAAVGLGAVGTLVMRRRSGRRRR